MYDYEKFVLTEREQRIFKKFKKSNTAELSETEYNLMAWKRLVDEQQISNNIDQMVTVRLSRIGEELRTYQKEHKRKMIRENVRYLITTAIAVIALILSLITYFK